MTEAHKIINSEVGRAVRKHPHWARYSEDLYQDAWVAVLRNPLATSGAFIRVSARHAIIQRALYYLGVHVRSGRSLTMTTDYDITWVPANDDRFAEYEDADELRYMRERKNGRLRSLAAKIAKHNRVKPIEHRMQTLEMHYRYKTSGERMEDIARVYGISKQAVSLRLAVAKRDLGEAA